MTIGMLGGLMVVLMNSFIGMRKSQGATITSNMLNVAGQRALKSMYAELTQAKQLLAGTLGDASPTIGQQYYDRLDKSTPPAELFDSTTELVFPTVNPIGAFGVTGTTTGRLVKSTVGNVLVFVMSDGEISIAKPGISMKALVGPIFDLATKPYLMPRYRIVAYYPVKVSLPPGAAPLDPTYPYTVQLVRWMSQPIVSKGDFQAFLKAQDPPPLPTGLNAVNELMSEIYGNGDNKAVGVIDLDETDPALSFKYWPLMTLLSGPLRIQASYTARPPTELIPRETEQYVAKPALAGYSLTSLSFDTNAGFSPGDDAFVVPAYAAVDAAQYRPYGFEVAIAGPVGARLVLTRISLAAKLQSGGNIFAMAHQEVVRVHDR